MPVGTAQSNRLPTVDVVVVNFNAGDQIISCLHALRNATKSRFQLSRVLIVDNASSDRSTEMAATLPLPLQVIRNDQNRGFGAAANQGARAGASNFILFLNPDARLDPSCLDTMCHQISRSAPLRVRVVGPALLDDSGALQRTSARMPRPIDLVAVAFGLHKLLPSAFDILLPVDAHRRSGPVEHVMGACYLVRRDAFEAVGGFDQNFFMYLEDLDLSYRIRAAGGAVWFEADASCQHTGGGVSRQVPVARLLYMVESRIRFARKHFSFAWALATLAAAITVEPVLRVAIGSIQRDPESVRVGFALWVELLRNARRLWAASRAV